MSGLAAALDDGIAAPARLRDLLAQELSRGETELQKKRSGYDEPVLVAFGARAGDGALTAALPVSTTFRADAAVVEERAWSVIAAAVGALQQASELPPPTRPDELALAAGDLGGQLTLTLGDAPGDPELAQLAFEEALQSVDRLRAVAVPLPPDLLDPADAKAPIGATHPLRVAEAVARLGGDPTDPDDRTEELVLALLEPRGSGGGKFRPHDDPDPAKRVARRILQRLDGMGKWGGYHTDFAHLARGFAGNERALADAVGESLLEADLLAEKPSVGQRHVFLNPRKAGEIRRLIEDGEVPPTLKLPRKW